MSERFERELREALQRCAAGVPEDAYERLREADYRPRSPVRRVGVALTTLATAGAAAAISLSLVGVGGGPQRAFAGWTPVPTPAASGRKAAAEAACLKETTRQVERTFTLEREMRRYALRQSAHEHASGRSTWHPLLSSRDTGGWQTAIADTRGPYTMVLTINGYGHATCLTGLEPSRVVGFGMGIGRSGPKQIAVPADGIIEASTGYTRGADGRHAFSYTSGKAGTSVKAVRLVLRDRTRVTASVANGWYLGWWPGDRPVVATETVAGGRTSIRPVRR